MICGRCHVECRRVPDDEEWGRKNVWEHPEPADHAPIHGTPGETTYRRPLQQFQLDPEKQYVAFPEPEARSHDISQCDKEYCGSAGGMPRGAQIYVDKAMAMDWIVEVRHARGSEPDKAGNPAVRRKKVPNDNPEIKKKYLMVPVGFKVVDNYLVRMRRGYTQVAAVWVEGFQYAAVKIGNDTEKGKTELLDRVLTED